jgi:hypothetical protein
MKKRDMKRDAELAEQCYVNPSEFNYKKYADLIRADEREECIQNVVQQYEGFGTEHQGVEYVKQRIVEAIRARSKA